MTTGSQLQPLRARFPLHLFVHVAFVLALLGASGCSHFVKKKPDELYQQARTALERGQLPAALEACDRGLQKYGDQPEWAWRFRVSKAEVLIWQGKAKDSLAMLDAPFPASLANSEIAVRRQIIRGISDYNLQRSDDATAAFSDAENLATASHRELLGDVANAQTAFAIRKGDYAAAAKYGIQALEAARSQKRRFLEAGVIGNMGFVALRQHRWGEAIDLFNGGLPIGRELQNDTLIEKFSLNLGWCYFKVGDFERALAIFTETEAISARLGLVKDQLILLDNIGNIYQERREYAEATAYYQRSLELARKLENKVAAAAALNNLASTNIETHQYEQAEQYNRQALELNRAIGDKESELYSLLNEARIMTGRKDWPGAISLLEQIARDAGQDVSLRWEAQADLGDVYAAEQNPALAETQFRTALATVDTARAGLKKEEQRLSFLANAKRFYNDYIDFLIEHNRGEEALRVAEHSRARTLAEGLGLKTDLKEAAFRPVQVAGKQKAVLLYYWLKPGQSYLWAVPPSAGNAKTIRTFHLPPDEEIAAKLKDYRKALMGPRDVRETRNATGQELYKILVAPAQDLLSPGGRVIVMADGPLHSLNFETLLVPGPQLHYWIEDAVITNANSIALLASSRKPAAHPRNLLLIGDPKYSGGEFQPLPQAAQEVKRVEDHFAPQMRMVLAADQARPQSYGASDPGKFSFIHFVAHATASQTSPLDSSIILTKDGENARLYARDIMQQPLSADLVTISACYGSGTREYSGEGLVGLSWAFLRAGAHHVIAALWEVNDASTPQLMDGLYTEMARGQAPADALRTAKLAMLHSDSVFRRPFYWGAFQLYSGD